MKYYSVPRRSFSVGLLGEVGVRKTQLCWVFLPDFELLLRRHQYYKILWFGIGRRICAYPSRHTTFSNKVDPINLLFSLQKGACPKAQQQLACRCLGSDLDLWQVHISLDAILNSQCLLSGVRFVSLYSGFSFPTGKKGLHILIN